MADYGISFRTILTFRSVGYKIVNQTLSLIITSAMLMISLLNLYLQDIKLSKIF